MEVILDDLRVMYVQAKDGPQGAREAFNKLESRLSTLKGRRFYGTFQPSDRSYRACVVLQEGDDPEVLRLETWVMPGGKYARRTMKDWTPRTSEIPRTFDVLSEEYKDRVDVSRPSIEFYRSQKELILFLPLK